MKRCINLIVFSFCFLPAFSQQKNVKEQKEMCWWYEQPATKYWEGLPVATGRFAAMIGGKIAQEEKLLQGNIPHRGDDPVPARDVFNKAHFPAP